MTGRLFLFLMVSVAIVGLVALSIPPPKQGPKYPVPDDASVPVRAP